MPTSERRWASAFPSAGIGAPSISIVPLSIVSKRLMARHSVDLPDPDLALDDREIDVLQDVEVAEVLVHAAHDDHGPARARSGDRAIIVSGSRHGADGIVPGTWVELRVIRPLPRQEGRDRRAAAVR
jgi:hypothetical protein